jgi:hypothetical protein
VTIDRGGNATRLAVTDEGIRDLIEKFQRVPDRMRDLEFSLDWAWQRLRVPSDVLLQMVDSGMAHRMHGGELLVDWLDILNCAMQLDLGPYALAVRRSWPAALERADQGGRPRYEMRYRVKCEHPDEPHDACRYEFLLPGGERVTRTGEQPRGRAEVVIEVSPDTQWPELPAGAREAIDTTAGLEFMLLPEEIRRDLGFLRETGLADCAGVALLLCEQMAAREVPVRDTYGYVVVPPYAVEHFWAEVGVGERWVPVDPVLIQAMVRWKILDGSRWHPYRSLGPIVARVGPDRLPAVLHNGAATAAMLPVRMLR